MENLKKLGSLNRKLCTGIEWVGVFAFVLMMSITSIDVLGTKLFLAPLPGALDIMMVAQLIAISFAISSTLMEGGHIQVEFFITLFPKRIQNIADLIVNLLGFILFGLITWHLFKFGFDIKEYGEVSPTIRMPLYPFVMAAALACIPACLIYLHDFFQSLIKVFTR